MFKNIKLIVGISKRLRTTEATKIESVELGLYSLIKGTIVKSAAKA